MPRRKSAGRQRPANGSSEGNGYRHPIPSPVDIVAALERHGIPLSFGQLADEFAVTGDKPRKALRRRLQKLVAGGRLLINRQAEYCLVNKLDVVTGKVSAHADGFGFLVPDNESEDIFLPFVHKTIIDKKGSKNNKE